MDFYAIKIRKIDEKPVVLIKNMRTPLLSLCKIEIMPSFLK